MKLFTTGGYDHAINLDRIVQIYWHHEDSDYRQPWHLTFTIDNGEQLRRDASEEQFAHFIDSYCPEERERLERVQGIKLWVASDDDSDLERETQADGTRVKPGHGLRKAEKE